MNITLIGYGKMGKELDRIASERGFTVIGRWDIDTPIKESEIEKTDVAIHFAAAESVLPHVQRWASAKKDLVIGTTGWQSDFEKVKAVVSETGIGLVHAPNFSLGVNVFFQLAEAAARLMNRFSEYDVTVHESHHKDKVDSPSGTALSAAKILLSHIQRKKTIKSDQLRGKIKPEELLVTSTRVGAVVGTHAITFDSMADTIEIRHDAKNRTGFALGALLAAEWINGKKGLYTMADVLSDIIR